MCFESDKTPSCFHCRRTRGEKSSRRAGKQGDFCKHLMVCIPHRVRISRAHFLLVCFPFVVQSQDCLKSCGWGDPGTRISFKNINRRISFLLSSVLHDDWKLREVASEAPCDFLKAIHSYFIIPGFSAFLILRAGVQPWYRASKAILNTK